MRAIRRFFNRYRGIIISVLLLFVFVVGVFYGIIPTVRRIVAIIGEIQEEQKQVQALRTKLSFLQSLDEKTLENQIRTVVSAIPTDKSLPSLMVTVEESGVGAGAQLMELNLISPGSLATESARRQTTEEAKLGSSLLPFTVVLEGSYEQIRTFMETTRSIRRLMRVRNFTISSSEAETLSSRLTMDAFWAPLPKSLGDVNKILSPLSEKDEALLAKVATLPWPGQFVAQEVVPHTSGVVKANPFSPAPPPSSP